MTGSPAGSDPLWKRNVYWEQQRRLQLVVLNTLHTIKVSAMNTGNMLKEFLDKNINTAVFRDPNLWDIAYMAVSMQSWVKHPFVKQPKAAEGEVGIMSMGWNYQGGGKRLCYCLSSWKTAHSCKQAKRHIIRRLNRTLLQNTNTKLEKETNTACKLLHSSFIKDCTQPLAEASKPQRCSAWKEQLAD